MSRNILIIIDEIIKLLNLCAHKDQAKWFQERKNTIRDTENIEEYAAALKEIKRVLVGMGSFTDLPMCPTNSRALSAKEARHLQWELASKLGEAIGLELNGKSNSENK